MDDISEELWSSLRILEEKTPAAAKKEFIPQAAAFEPSLQYQCTIMRRRKIPAAFKKNILVPRAAGFEHHPSTNQSTGIIPYADETPKPCPYEPCRLAFSSLSIHAHSLSLSRSSKRQKAHITANHQRVERCDLTKPPRGECLLRPAGGRNFGNEAWQYHRSLDRASTDFAVHPPVMESIALNEYLRCLLGTQIGRRLATFHSRSTTSARYLLFLYA
jgi:hypothetical protein